MTSHGHDHHAHGHQHGDGSSSVELLDLDGQVLHEYYADALDFVAGHVENPSLVLDLGAGTGVGGIGLATRFPDAAVVAIDISDDSLERIREKVVALDLADRVRALNSNLDEGLPELGAVDLTWASMSLHHVGDPVEVLRRLLATTEPGGIVAVAEFSDPVRVLPETLTQEQVWVDRQREEYGRMLPHLGAHWSEYVASAGFDVIAECEFAFSLTYPYPPELGRYAQLWLGRLADRFDQDLPEEDRALLERLAADSGPESVRERRDLHLRGSRTITIGRAPA